ncbi:MAG TPA: dihydrodipicolinate synthase family protein [Planctomycetota bacterium]|nr:dihydrodipicolinate synthase family protein [Planctomycetota bacterium]
MIRGTLAASVTPLRDGGRAVDEEAFAPMVDFLARGGVDGILACGTTGEGILLSPGERRRVAELFVRASAGRLAIAVHCGAQTTADTVALAAHAAEIGAAAVAVIAPPYYTLDEAALLAHFEAAARACAPLPFFVYEFAKSSGYAVPVPVIDRLREREPRFVGLKVSDTPWDRFEPYLVRGLDVLVGPEAFIARGLAAGAVGAVSGLASAFPEVVAALVRAPTDAEAARVGDLRASLQALPFHAAMKAVLARRGVPVRGDVRAPLRGLTDAERARLDRVIEPWLGS